MRPISLAHLTVLDADPLTLIDAGAAGGFDAVGLRIIPPMPTEKIVEVIGNAPLQRDIKARLTATGLYILDVEAIWLLPEMNVEKLLPALDLSAELGARYMLVCGHDPDWSRMTANLATLGEAADARGRRLMLEPMSYIEVNSLQSANALLKAASPANAGLLVDALHLSRSGGSPADLAAYDPALFSYMHLCDAARTPPGPEACGRNGAATASIRAKASCGFPNSWMRSRPVRRPASRRPARSMPTCRRWSGEEKQARSLARSFAPMTVIEAD